MKSGPGEIHIFRMGALHSYSIITTPEFSVFQIVNLSLCFVLVVFSEIQHHQQYFTRMDIECMTKKQKTWPRLNLFFKNGQ